MLDISLAILLTVLALAGWLLNVLGMPGNWILVALGGACYWFRPESYMTHMALLTLASMIAVAGLGELLEFVASALGAKRQGATTRGTALAILGSVVGAIAGLFFGTAIPIPIVGNVIGSLLLGAAGAFAGAIAGERWAGKDWDTSLQIGSAAFWGRLLGTIGKVVCGTVVCAVFMAAVWL